MDLEELQKKKIRYDTALSLWKLASEQIYSRFTAMLTGNSIIIAATVLVFINKQVSNQGCFIKALTISGLILCVAWLIFMICGYRTETRYREKAHELQEVFTGGSVIEPVKKVLQSDFLWLTIITVVVFISIYIFFLCNLPKG